jgi:hypothetical protein
VSLITNAIIVVFNIALLHSSLNSIMTVSNP